MKLTQKYFLVSKLNSGHFGSVFKAKSIEDDWIYAIKKILLNRLSDRDKLR